MRHRHLLRTLLIALLLAGAQGAPGAHAASGDALLEGAKLCTRHLARYEREYGVPTHLLSAIATTESGRYHEGLKIRVPWPWTINVEGKGYFFDNEDEAIAAVRKFKARGAQSIDVGCMQVNLQQHPDAFASLSQAFDPQTNIAYAAGFLRTLYNEDNSWKKAAADYHSKTPERGSKYALQVYDSWFQIISKLRAARLQVPESTVQAMNDMGASNVTRVTSADRPASFKVLHLAEQAKKPAYRPIHMNSISVSQKQPDPGLIVVKPDITVVNDAQAADAAPEPVVVRIPAAASISALAPASGAPTTVAMAQTPAAIALPARASDAPVVNVDNRRVETPSQAAEKKTGPTFIFSD